MMWLRGLLGFIFAVKATSAFCEPFLVQAGEHGRFTRLVVSAVPDIVWSAQQNAGSVELRIPAHSDGFTTANTFSRIDRSRIASIEALSDTLKIKINCDCDVATFVDQGRHIVIDVGDKSHKFVGALLGDDKPPRNPASGFSATSGFAWPFPSQKSGQTLTELSFIGFQKQLALDIGRMVTLDILEDVPVKPKRLAEKSPQLSKEGNDSSEPLQLGPANQMIITDLISDLDITRPSGPSAADCAEIDALAIFLTDQTATYEDYVAAQRAFAATEHDGASQFNLSVKALGLGFGTEARLSLSSMDQSDRKVRLATAVAELLESDETAHMASLAEAVKCNRDFTFWHFLGNDPKFETSEELNKEILRKFDRLPSSLKRLLGARLAKRFRTNGDLEAAILAMNAIERAPEQPPTELISERAANDLDTKQTSLPETLGKLLPDQVVATDAEMFIAELNARLANDLDVTLADSHLLDSFLFAETEEKPRLELLKAAFFVSEKLKQDQKSFGILSEIQTRDKNLAAALHDSFLKEKLEKSSDFDLIETGLFSLQKFGDQMDPVLRETLLSRMKIAGITGDIVGEIQADLLDQNPKERGQGLQGTETVTTIEDTAFQLSSQPTVERSARPAAQASVEGTGQKNLSGIEAILREVEQTRTSLAREISAWATVN